MISNQKQIYKKSFMERSMNKVLFEEKEIFPSKVVCVGRNYAEHIYELGNEIPSSMVLFMKPNSSISQSLHVRQDEPVHYEGELSFLVKDSKIEAVAFGLDLTKRELQNELKKSSLPWERAKAFDGAAVFSPFVKVKQADIKSLSLKLYINDRLMQKGGVESMMYKPADIIKEIENFSTLLDGDIVMSGTPKGVGIVNQKDNFRAEIFIADKRIIQHSWIAE